LRGSRSIKGKKAAAAAAKGAAARAFRKNGTERGTAGGKGKESTDYPIRTNTRAIEKKNKPIEI
jgi:hypothetical protein